MTSKNNTGWIAELGIENYNHQFGGDTWEVLDKNPLSDGPTLLLVLDLKDPRLSELHTGSLKSLPICSYINCDVWGDPQHFKILPNENKTILVKRSENFRIILDDDEKFPNPLPAKPLKLREMFDSEIDVDENVDEEAYWQARETFVGGSSFIRILGDPLWLQFPESPLCLCGKEEKYVCSIGYEVYDSRGIIDDRAFFIGEGVLYFFLCFDCLILTCLSQST